MLKCPKCGTDNLLTAVFCRGCGERIPLDELKPDDFNDTGAKAGVDNTKQNIIGGIIIGVLVLGALIAFFCPACGKISYNEEVGNATISKIEKIGKGESITLTDEEASCYATARLKAYAEKNEDSMGSPKPTAATIHFLGDNAAKVVVSGKLGFMPVSIKANVTVSVSNKSIDFNLDGKPVIGLIPISDSFRDKVYDNFPAVFNKALGGDNKRVKEVKVEEGKVTITRTGKKSN